MGQRSLHNIYKNFHQAGTKNRCRRKGGRGGGGGGGGGAGKTVRAGEEGVGRAFDMGVELQYTILHSIQQVLTGRCGNASSTKMRASD